MGQDGQAGLGVRHPDQLGERAVEGAPIYFHDRSPSIGASRDGGIDGGSSRPLTSGTSWESRRNQPSTTGHCSGTSSRTAVSAVSGGALGGSRSSFLDSAEAPGKGITPLGINYFDGKYIKSIHEKFGKLPMRTYPLLTFNRFLYWSCIARIKRIRPYWYISYSKIHARKVLEEKFGWEYYGGHHHENKMTKFAQSVYLPQKFDTDERNNELSGEVRIGDKTREEALGIYNTPPEVDGDLVEYFRKRLGFSKVGYERIMSMLPRHWSEYPTYKKRFELLRPLFYILAKRNLVPMSFYLKYCFPVKGE